MVVNEQFRKVCSEFLQFFGRIGKTTNVALFLAPIPSCDGVSSDLRLGWREYVRFKQRQRDFRDSRRRSRTQLSVVRLGSGIQRVERASARQLLAETKKLDGSRLRWRFSRPPCPRDNTTK